MWSSMPSKSFDKYTDVVIADILLSRTRSTRPLSSLDSKVLDAHLPFRGLCAFSHLPARRLGFVGVPLSTLLMYHLTMVIRCGFVFRWPVGTRILMMSLGLMLCLLAN